jgi:hypothetical protein
MSDTLPDGLTRFTTLEERENIAGIALNPEDVDSFLSELKKGLMDAAQMHDTAVQDNFGLRAETTVRLSRPVRDEDGSIVDHVGIRMATSTIRGEKIFVDPDKAPKVGKYVFDVSAANGANGDTGAIAIAKQVAPELASK